MAPLCASALVMIPAIAPAGAELNGGCGVHQVPSFFPQGHRTSLVLWLACRNGWWVLCRLLRESALSTVANNIQTVHVIGLLVTRIELPRIATFSAAKGIHFPHTPNANPGEPYP